MTNWNDLYVTHTNEMDFVSQYIKPYMLLKMPDKLATRDINTEKQLSDYSDKTLGEL